MRAFIGLAATVALVLAGGFAALCGEPAKRQSATTPAVVDEFRITGECTSPLMLSVDFAGRKLPAILDTGSTVTVFDVSLRPLLGARRMVQRTSTPTGTASIERFAAPEFRMGRIEIPAGAETVGCRDLAALRDLFGEDIRLVIGMDALKGRVIRIDFLNGKLSFLREPPPKTAGAIPIRYFGGTPWIAGSVDAAVDTTVVAYFQIDTGWCDERCLGALSKSFFEDLRTRGSLVPVRDREIVTMNGTTAVRSGRLTAPLFIANRTYRSTIFSEQSYCLVGLPFLCRYTLTVDLVNNLLYLDPAIGPFTALGIETAWQHKDLVVVSVAKGSRAEIAGILEGDLISSLNRTEAREATEQYHCEEAESAGKAQTLVIRRGPKSIEVSFAPLFTPLNTPKSPAPPRAAR